jgi:hypothetical protein
MGAITASSPTRSLSAAFSPVNISYGLGGVLTNWLYTGTQFDFLADASGTGNAVVPVVGTVPTDAVAMELQVNGNAVDDYLFVTTTNSGLAAAGNFAANIALNVLNVRYVTNGQPMVVPLLAVGTALTAPRVATGKASARCQGRWISQSSNLPYLLGSTTADLLTGANSQQQFTFGSSTKYPAGYSAILMQVLGPGPIRIYTDGTAVTSTTGFLLGPGTYLVDFAKHGISMAALKMYLPTGTNVVSNALMPA